LTAQKSVVRITISTRFRLKNRRAASSYAVPTSFASGDHHDESKSETEKAAGAKRPEHRAYLTIIVRLGPPELKFGQPTRLPQQLFPSKVTRDKIHIALRSFLRYD
jgi:hypothetical protein